MSLFSPEERLIFCYMIPDAGETGQKAIYADPLVVRRRLMQTTHGEFDQILADASEPDPGAPLEADIGVMARITAQEKLAACARETFNLPPINPATGEGFTEAIALNVLDQFLEWLAKNVSAGGTTPAA